MNPDYRPYHPKWYRRRVPIFWWLRQGAYFKFIARELTSLLVAYSALLFLALVVAIDRGEASYLAFVAWVSQPIVIGFHVAVLLGTLFHTITWLNLAPMALAVKVGSRRVPARAILLGHYAAWVACTAVVVWALVGR